MRCSREVYRTVKDKNSVDRSYDLAEIFHRRADMNVTLDECFQFGLGAFETIGIEQGIPILLDKHLKRLERAADFLKLGSLSERGITARKIEKYLEEQKMRTEVQKEFGNLEHCALKIMLTKENMVYSLRANHYTPEKYEKGFFIDISAVKRNETSPLVYHKTMNYGDCILEKRNATAAGMDERLFLNTKEQVSEGTVSNVFFVRNGVICTPQVSCGLLPGILREYLCETEDVEETDIYVQDLKRYQECFVTNSLMGIMPVRQIGGIRFEEDRVTKELMRKYQDMVQETINKKKDR